MNTEDLVKWGVIGLGAYLLWQWWQSAGNVVSAATAPFANWYVNFTTPPVTPLGNAIFANGTYVPMSMITPNWVGNSLQFTYLGVTYALSSHDANGNYPATPV